MTRRLIQIVLFASLFCGAATQTLACVSTWVGDQHACCRTVIPTKSSLKMRAASPSHKQPATPAHCCASNTANTQQAVAKHTESRQGKYGRIADDGQASLTLIERTIRRAAPVTAPAEHSPPRFILHLSLLI